MTKNKVKTPLVLASQSMARRKMLEDVGLFFSLIPADLDEEKIVRDFQAQKIAPGGIALELSQQKALKVAESKSEALVIGADQILEFEGQLLSKAKSFEEARERLKSMRGKTHKLISAVSVVKGKDVLWQSMDEAILTMHDFDDEFLEVYCARAGEALMRAVGGYELESYGAWLFSAVQGSFFTVLGLPLLPLLTYLRDEQGITP